MEVKKINVWIMLLLSIVTLGLYSWFWIIQRRDFFAKISPKVEIKKSMGFICAMIIAEVILKLLPTGRVLHSLQAPYPTIVNLSQLSLCVLIMYGFFSIIFNYEKKLIEYFKENEKDVSMNDWFTILLNIYYLQHKINKEIAPSMNNAPTEGITPTEWGI